MMISLDYCARIFENLGVLATMSRAFYDAAPRAPLLKIQEIATATTALVLLLVYDHL